MRVTTDGVGSPRLSARRYLATVLDRGSFSELEHEARAVVPHFSRPSPFRTILATARRTTGERESVITAFGRVRGHPVAAASFEFGFVAGTIGTATGDKLVHLFDAARVERRPTIVRYATGGARLQEGTVALVQMARVARAAQEHRMAGLAQVSVLDDPTTGGAYAGFGAHADVLIGVPGARIGFLGVRAGGATDSNPESDRHPADRVVDAWLDISAHRSYLARLLDATSDDRSVRASTDESEAPSAPRLTPLWYLGGASDHLLCLNGDRRGGVDAAVLCGLARINGSPFAAIVVRSRGDDHAPVRPGPFGLARVRRHARLAQRLGLPLISFLDSPGVEASTGAETRNVAGEIASTFALFTTLEVPTMSVIVGGGGGGGCFALAAADRLVMVEHASLPVIAPAAAAGILLGAPERSEELAAELRISAEDNLSVGIVDRLLPLGDRRALREEMTEFLAAPPAAERRVPRWNRLRGGPVQW